MNDAREKIAEVIKAHCPHSNDWEIDGASLAVLSVPPRIVRGVIKPLDFTERRCGYHGCPRGYQVAHTVGDIYRVRHSGRVLCKNIKGYDCAVKWANGLHKSTILKHMGLDT